MKNLKKDFPFFANNPEITYCDSAATTQKPQVVIDRMGDFYAHKNAPIYRGIYKHAEQATTAYEGVREQVRDFIGAEHADEIIFTQNATAGINLVAHAWARHTLTPGDEIVLTELEHHANLVPWLQIAQEMGIIIRYVPVLSNGTLDYTRVPTLIGPKTKLVAVSALSNVTGHEVDLDYIQKYAYAAGAAFLVDACQIAPRRNINVTTSKIDFLVFSGHKMLGPSGVGILFVNRKFHSKMVPFFGGGSAVQAVDFDAVHWRNLPYRYEAGTQAIENVVGLGAALDYLKQIDCNELRRHEALLCKTLIGGLKILPQITVLGDEQELIEKGHLVSFVVKGMHAHDVAAYFDHHDIAVRAGHHCAQPLHKKLGINGSVRVSFYLYNTFDDVAKILNTLTMLLK